MNGMYDVIIIGGGPAGMTAAIYSARRALKTLVLSSDIGGQMAKTTEVENYPGLNVIGGFEISNRFKNQAEKFGARIIIEEVREIAPDDDNFMVKTNLNQYKCTTIILAYGKKPRELGIPGEEQFKGRGVTYCATCDAPFYKGKKVVVVGGGNSALDAAILCSKIAGNVYLIYRGAEFRAEQYLIDKVKEAANIELIFNGELAEISGNQTVKAVKLKSGEIIPTDGVMIEIGYVVDRSLTENLVEHDIKNQVVVDELQQTSRPGIFAAGDLTPTPYKQIVISAAEGAKAALSCFDYIQKKQGKRGIAADWH